MPSGARLHHFYAVCDFCNALSISVILVQGRRAVAERDLTALEDRFIGLCLAAAAIIIVFIYLVSYS
jgi:hypothetical protein